MINQADANVDTSHDPPDITHQRSERVKEPDCLFGISRLVEYVEYSIVKTLQNVVAIIQPSLQDPGNT